MARTPYGSIYIAWHRESGKGYGGLTRCWRRLGGKWHYFTPQEAFERRKRWHLKDSKYRPTTDIDRAIALFGAKAFEWVLVGVAFSRAELNAMEIAVIAMNEFDNPEFGWNVSPGGSRISRETQLKISASNAIANKGKILSEGTKAKIAAFHKGKKKSPEAIEKAAAHRRGRKHTPEHVEKCAAKLRGRKQPPELVERIAATHRGEKAYNSILTGTNVLEIRALTGVVSGPEMAKRYGVNKNTIYAVRSRRIWKHLPAEPTDAQARRRAPSKQFGERSNGSKLKEDEVLQIREEAAEQPKPSLAEIGHRHSISYSTVRRIVNRKTWKHI